MNGAEFVLAVIGFFANLNIVWYMIAIVIITLLLYWADSVTG